MLSGMIRAYDSEDVPTPDLDADQTLLLKQRAQFEGMISKEREFRDYLVSTPIGQQMYRDFMRKICDENGNKLTVRPYFRERQAVCIGPIVQALKNRSAEELYQYHFNFNFIDFVMKQRRWPARSRLVRLAAEIAAIRQKIIVTNMPLAISQARLFWSKAPAKTQDTRFTFLDFVQIGADGLTSAVDKFVIPSKLELDNDPGMISIWRSVAIQRMTGNFIEMFGETSIHFFPRDKRILYRANKHLKDHQGQIDFEKLAQQVNEDLRPDGPQTTASELASLMGAASTHTSADTNDDPDSQDSVLERSAATADWQPDTRFEQMQLGHVLRRSLKLLPLQEQKLLVLKGVARDSI
jgi:DNA-directed RNA polymerase specialized sigma subunit